MVGATCRGSTLIRQIGLEKREAFSFATARGGSLPFRSARFRAISDSDIAPKRTRAAYRVAHEQGAAAGELNRQKVYREYLARKYRERQSRT